MATAKAARYNEILLSPAGKLLANTAVTVRLPNSAAKATLYTDENKTAEAPNPTTSDSYGNLSFWADWDSHYDLAAGATVIEDVAVTPSHAALTGTFVPFIQGVDLTGTTDSATAIDNTLTAAGENAEVHFQAGTYRLRAKSIQPLNGQRLVFARGVVLKPDPYVSPSDTGIVSSVNRGAIEILHKTDVTIVGGTVDGQRITYNAGQLFGVNILGNCKRITIDGTFVKDVPSTGAGISFGDGIYIGQGDGALRGIPEDILITGCTVENSGRQNITVTHGRRVRVVANSSNRAFSSGIDVEPNYPGDACEDVLIEANTFFDNGQGINISSDNNNYAGALIVQGNTIRRTTRTLNLEGISCYAPGAQIVGNRIINGWHGVHVVGRASGLPHEDRWGRHTVVADNHIEGCKFGIRFTPNWTIVVGNSLRNCTDHGIVVDGSVADAVDSIVANNLLVDCNDPATASAGNEANLLLAASPKRITVIGNSIVDTRTGTARAKYGISVTSTAANEHLTHNIFANNIENMQLAALTGTPEAYDEVQRGLALRGGAMLPDGANFVFGTGTGTRFGTTPTQKFGFWGTTPTAQLSTVADATDLASVIALANDLKLRLRMMGLLA